MTIYLIDNDCHKAAQWVGKTDEIRFKSREVPARLCKFVKMLIAFILKDSSCAS